MLKFNKKLKIYLFKNLEQVSLSIRVSKTTVNTFRLDQQSFEQLVLNWQQPDGVKVLVKNNHWFIQLKTRGPRPERAVVNYVRISVGTRDMEYNYRVGFDDMLELQKEYYYQKHNIMYWD